MVLRTLRTPNVVAGLDIFSNLLSSSLEGDHVVVVQTLMFGRLTI